MATVCVLGSLHYDILVDAPDRPRKGETIAGSAWRPKFGGKGGNQAVAAARAGATTTMIGMVGADSFGALLVDNLARHGVDASLVEVAPGVASGMSVAIFDKDRDYGAVIVSGANLSLDASVVQRTARWITSSDVLVLQNEVS
ncbi:MAG: PfkB family carbohydrate kinase, partial [Devosia sp.]